MKSSVIFILALKATIALGQSPSLSITRCPTFTTTVTLPAFTEYDESTSTFCPQCSESSTIASSSNTTPASTPAGPSVTPTTQAVPNSPEKPGQEVYTTTYKTVWSVFCPTGLQPSTYTITETCSGKPTPPNPTHIPAGYGVTVSACDSCGPAPLTETLTICTICENTTTTPAGANPNVYFTTYRTTYSQFCSTGLEAETYTITEACTGARSAPNPTHVPQGFTTTIGTCTTCGPTPITALLTVPVSPNAEPFTAGSPGFEGASSMSWESLPTKPSSGGQSQGGSQSPGGSQNQAPTQGQAASQGPPIPQSPASSPSLTASQAAAPSPSPPPTGTPSVGGYANGFYAIGNETCSSCTSYGTAAASAGGQSNGMTFTGSASVVGVNPVLTIWVLGIMGALMLRL
ncbi:MAG: hypothetical protein M1827_004274 [Pycnora praestabilis]|nr:MAG: hypothetical protein M1827_004274 [Pycnora praestabilis]